MKSSLVLQSKIQSSKTGFLVLITNYLFGLTSPSILIQDQKLIILSLLSSQLNFKFRYPFILIVTYIFINFSQIHSQIWIHLSVIGRPIIVFSQFLDLYLKFLFSVKFLTPKFIFHSRLTFSQTYLTLFTNPELGSHSNPILLSNLNLFSRFL